MSNTGSRNPILPDADSPVLVTGGTGKTGRRIAERLTAAGRNVRVVSRNTPVPFDWENRATWDAALEGIGAVYLCYFPDLAVPGAAETVAAFARHAVGKGIRRQVLLSARGERGAEHAEALFKASGAAWTILRADWFNQNFSEAFFLDGVLAGEVALPVGDVREPFIDADDIADVAFATLAEEGHVGKLYELTGPRLMSFQEMVTEIGRATGRDIRFSRVPAEEYVAGLHAQGIPQDFIDLLHELFTEVLDGRNESLTDDVQRVLGRPPRDFSAYVAATAATGVWDESKTSVEA
ncbi:NAD-dependent epimerase/dehydratase family protein [Nitratireductor pacificus]|uniref:NAD-dependent epimerase/dehydratase domain-containing protein n=1 Tax=Nitratireductor pacificus pht-3B TaxID=391937 RepID=K2LSH4_9HYPH|nr:NAD-dependent epimerase/dehydratase family protein [Nitratireductor pacificus]EKF20669.1 hypothetical protein NA2_02754 [Nitratireductor pacificus pht-3B]